MKLILKINIQNREAIIFFIENAPTRRAFSFFGGHIKNEERDSYSLKHAKMGTVKSMLIRKSNFSNLI